MATTSQPNQNNATINLSKIECIPPKNTIATINQFIINTSDFINRFAYFSEEKLLNLDEEIERLETQLILLEKKLETIPSEYFSNVNTQVTTTLTPSNPAPPEISNTNPTNSVTNNPPPPPPPPNINVTQNPGAIAPPPINLLLAGGAKNLPPPPPPPPIQQTNDNTNNENNAQTQQQTTNPNEENKQPEEQKNELPDEYKKYKRLADIGVPFLQFKPKMIAEGLDPSVLEKFLELSKQ